MYLSAWSGGQTFRQPKTMKYSSLLPVAGTVLLRWNTVEYSSMMNHRLFRIGQWRNSRMGLAPPWQALHLIISSIRKCMYAILCNNMMSNWLYSDSNFYCVWRETHFGQVGLYLFRIWVVFFLLMKCVSAMWIRYADLVYVWLSNWSFPSAFGVDDDQNQPIADWYGIVMGTR